MFKKKLVALTATAAVLAAPAHRAAADVGDALLGGIVGGVVTGVIINEANKNKPRPTKRVYVTPRPDSPARAANRVTQTSLNYFGFNAGGADGVFGPQTARAVSSYQAFLQFPVTGQLTPFQREVLVGAYNRGQVGDYATMQLVSTDPMGARALLIAQRDMMTGKPPASGGGAPVTTMASAESDAPPAAEAPATPETPPLVGLPVIPVPTGNGQLAAFCSSPTVTGPRITPVSMTDPKPALEQVFCGARAEAIDDSTGLANSVQGVTLADIEAQCEQLGPVMASYVTSLYGKPRADVIGDVTGFVSSSGTDSAQLASTAKICLGIGYRKDNMNVALGSGLLLVALGQPAYGELMGHHLYHGFGTAANQDRAMDWLIWTTDELANGATPVFGDGARTELVDEAVYRLNGGAPASAAKSTSTKGKLPVVQTNN
ncbi:peptidoglycan-binding domain-containing protein [Pseudoruegeria sp. HB172150]|uniref:peptidoglycan-binding domain-containing protein n=1 Tax=Pseudoruegeria sp. HB172150 TaxID=2721164 RepID=UPI00155652DC|nr:peptidoglycan-binding domain-containing protein [Pseudoruegeria sp. HB172150]